LNIQPNRFNSFRVRKAPSITLSQSRIEKDLHQSLKLIEHLDKEKRITNNFSDLEFYKNLTNVCIQLYLNLFLVFAKAKCLFGLFEAHSFLLLLLLS
jgi:hypothetical protein